MKHSKRFSLVYCIVISTIFILAVIAGGLLAGFSLVKDSNNFVFPIIGLIIILLAIFIPLIAFNFHYEISEKELLVTQVLGTTKIPYDGIQRVLILPSKKNSARLNRVTLEIHYEKNLLLNKVRVTPSFTLAFITDLCAACSQPVPLYDYAFFNNHPTSKDLKVWTNEDVYRARLEDKHSKVKGTLFHNGKDSLTTSSARREFHFLDSLSRRNISIYLYQKNNHFYTDVLILDLASRSTLTYERHIEITEELVAILYENSFNIDIQNELLCFRYITDTEKNDAIFEISLPETDKEGSFILKTRLKSPDLQRCETRNEGLEHSKYVQSIVNDISVSGEIVLNNDIFHFADSSRGLYVFESTRTPIITHSLSVISFDSKIKLFLENDNYNPNELPNNFILLEKRHYPLSNLMVIPVFAHSHADNRGWTWSIVTKNCDLNLKFTPSSIIRFVNPKSRFEGYKAFGSAKGTVLVGGKSVSIKLKDVEISFKERIVEK